MDNTSEIAKNLLQGRLAWLTALTLIPVTLLASWAFGIWLEDELLFKIPFGGAVITFFAGACIDQTAHIICCCTGIRGSLIMRICASVLELIGMVWFTIWLCAELFELLLLLFPIILFLLLICLWKAFEIWSLMKFVEYKTHTQTMGVLGFFSSLGIILGLLFALMALFIWIQYAEYLGYHMKISALPANIGYGLATLSFSFIPVYMITLSLHTRYIRNTLGSECGE